MCKHWKDETKVHKKQIGVVTNTIISFISNANVITNYPWLFSYQVIIPKAMFEFKFQSAPFPLQVRDQ